jgi:lysozyme
MWEEVKKQIKDHEGFRSEIYFCSEKKATIGYGHLITPQDDFIPGAEQLINLNPINDTAKEVIIEMVFQMGKIGCAKFKKMWKALNREDYGEASFQMMDSLWAKQTPLRAKKLSEKMRLAK